MANFSHDNPEAGGDTSSPGPLAEAGSSMGVVRRLRRAFLSICRCGDVAFSPYRLTTDQYALLRAVQRRPGIRQTDLTEHIFAEPNTITAMVSLLERRGILRRKASASDRRVRLLYLTNHGEIVLQKLSEDWAPMREVLKQCFASEGGEKALLILDEVARQMQLGREKLLQKSEPRVQSRGRTKSGDNQSVTSRRKVRS